MQVNPVIDFSYYLTGCTNGDVRLVGGGFENEGTVEVCFDNLWGLISDVGWNEADAKVVCRKLGHEEGSEFCLYIFKCQKYSVVSSIS